MLRFSLILCSLSEDLPGEKGDKISAVVFDGIITQRLLDIASNKNVKEIVGIKIGNVVKMPKSVKILTKTDFQS